jgi:hypothetical protein
MEANTFDVITKRKRITMFKIGNHWVFKHFFDDKELFRELADHYDKNKRCDKAPIREHPTPRRRYHRHNRTADRISAPRSIGPRGRDLTQYHKQ